MQTKAPVSGQIRKAPSASAEAPLSNLNNQRRRKSQPQSSDSDSDEPLAKKRPTDQVTRRASVTSAKQDSRPGSVSSNATVDVPPRNALAIRKGKGAIRGGSSMQPKNVFINRDPPKKRPGLIQTSRDPSKDQKHFSNMHIIYKAQVAGRDLADAAPDIAALPGGLFDPSKPAQYQPLNPTSVRKTSSGVIQREGNIDDLFVSEGEPSEQASNASGSLPSHEYWESTRELERATCYFWFNNGGVCANRQNCSFLHRVVKGIPVSPRPNNLVDSFQPMTCYFWDLNGICGKGDTCKFLHYHEEGIPIAPHPFAREGAPRQPSGQETIPQSDQSLNIPSTPQMPLESPTQSQPPWHGLPKRDLSKIQSTCWFFKNKGTCFKGDNCGYLHIIDPSLPVAAPPPGFLPPSTESGNPLAEEEVPSMIDDYHPIISSPQRIENNAPNGHDSEPKRAPNAKEESSSSTLPQKSVSFADDTAMPDRSSTDRPPWNPCDPFKAICFYWDTWGGCNKGGSCPYTHRSDESLPRAPNPNQPELITCRHWAMGGCNHEPCGYPHRFMDDYLSYAKGTTWENLIHQAQNRISEPPVQADIFPPAKPIPKSVSFADDPSLPAPKEPEKLRPSTSKRPRWQPKDHNHAVCFKWYRDNYCPFGSDCKYIHDDPPHLPLSPFVTCRYWARGDCPRSDRKCDFVHEDQPDKEMSDDLPATSANALTLGSSSPSLERAPTIIRSKSVKFTGERPVHPLEDSPLKKMVGKILVVECEVWSPDSSFEVRVGDEIRIENHLHGILYTGTNLRTYQTGQFSKYIFDKRFAEIDRYKYQNKICHFWSERGCRNGKACVFKHEYAPGEEKFLESHREKAEPNPNSIVQPITSTRDHSHDVTISTPTAETEQSEHQYVPSEAQFAAARVEKIAVTTANSLPPIATTHGQPDGFDFAMPLNSHVIPAPKMMKSKISVEEYRRKKAVKSLGNRAKNIAFGSDEQAAAIFDIGDFGQETQTPWARMLFSLSDIRFDQSCIAQDFAAHRRNLQRQTLWEGSLVPADSGDAEASKVVDDLVEDLRLKSSGLIASFPGFFILTYPAKAEEWKFLEKTVDLPTEVRLRYIVSQSRSEIRPPLDPPAEVTWDLNSTSYRKDLVRAVHGLSVEHLIPYLDKDQKKNPYNFYLLFPPNANETAVFVTSWLQSSRPESRIFSSQTEGSWAYFVRNFGLGVVLVHESFASEICSLPMLSDLIYKRSTVNFWYISDSSSPYPMFPSDYELDHPSLGKLNATRLFPHGATFLLTPSFIVAEPERTYALLVWFFGKGTTKGKIDSSNPGTWKIVCCYGFKDYLLDVANAKSLERDRFYEANKDKPSKDAEATQKGLGFENCNARYKIHAFMTDVETRRFDMCSDSSIDYYSGIANENESPIIYADRDINPDDEKALVEWYAGWSVGRLDRFRKFAVVGTSSASALRASRLKSLPKEHAGAKGFTAFSFPQPDVSLRSELAAHTPEKQNALAVAAKLNNLHVNSKVAALKSNSALSPSIKSPQSPISGGMLAQTSPTRTVDSDMSMEMDISPVHSKPNNIAPQDDQNSPALNQTCEELDARITELIQNPRPKQTIADLIRNSTPNDNPRDLPRLTTTHLNINNSLPASAAATSAERNTSPYFSANSPFQFDGAADNRPISSGTDSSKTSRSGIQLSENGQRFVPRSVRPSGTVRPEISIKPGYISAEDKDVYRNRRVIDGVPQHEIGSNSNSNAGSPAAASPPIVSGSVFDSDEEGQVREEETWREIRFEATTAWYRALLAEGGGWGHVCVEGWEKAFEFLGVKK